MRRLLLTIALAGACHASPRPPVPPAKPLPRAAYAHYLVGKMAMYQQDWGAATVALAAALAAAPDEPMIVVELARAQVKAKDLAAAWVTLAQGRRTWPEHPEVWLASADLVAEGTADVREVDQVRAEAAGAYRRTIELAPDDERGYLGLARVEPANAERTLRTLVQRIPTSVDGHYRLAVRIAKRGDLAAAVLELRAVLERDPDHIDARLDLARALRRRGELDEAILQTRGAFDRAAQPLDVAEELFWLLCEVDDRTGAADLLTLLDDDRSDVESLATVARLDRVLGRHVEARAIAEKIRRQDADAGALALAEAEVATGDHAAALARVRAIPDSSEHVALARKLGAEILLTLGEPAKVADELAKVRASRPKDLDLALLAAFALADSNAAAAARATLRPLGDSPEAQLARARLEDRLGEHPAALGGLVRLLATHPDAVSALNLAGYLLIEAKRLPEAERHLRHARDLSPGDPAILDSWGLLKLRTGAVREAIRVLARASRYAPREPEILVHLAEAWSADRAPRTAHQLLDLATTLHPTPPVKRRIAVVRQAISGGR